MEFVRTLIKDLLGKGSGLFFVGVNIEAKFLTDGSFLGKSSITTLFAFGVRTLKIKMLVIKNISPQIFVNYFLFDSWSDMN